MMLRIACVAAAGVIACSHARAAEKTMPINFIGEWCYASQESKTTSYTLPSWTEDGHCTKILSIEQYQFFGEGQNCEPVGIRLTRDTAPSGTAYIATVTARCQPDGSTTAGKLQTFEFNRYKGNLTVTTEAGPEPKSQTGNPSFNCQHAKAPDEVAICQTPKLSEMDTKMANLYSGYRNLTSGPARHQLEVNQAVWLQHRRSCGRNLGCIAKAYKDRVDYLYQHNTPDVCGGPILKQPIGCDPGGGSEITDEDVSAFSGK
jgi:uncharacterized protein YecT (DUF1311 family)